MTRAQSRRPGIGLGVLAGVALLALVLLPSMPVAAQTPGSDGQLEILSVHHDPAGRLSVGIRASGGRGVEIQSLTMFVDDIPTTLDLRERETRDGLALMLVIDASASMDGPWMQAARQAARALIEQLPDGDRVGVISFSTTAVIESDLTTDHDAVLQAVDGIVAEGWTALYDAVEVGVDLLATAAEPSHVMIVLADGEDNRSERTAAESIQRAVESGVQVYTVGIGRLFDPTYLDELADLTNGEFMGTVTESNDGALTGLFERLGGELGARDRYTIPMRTLKQGSHVLNVRAVIDGQPVSATARFEVTNEGLLQPSIAAPPAPGEAIRVQTRAVGTSGELSVEAHVGGLVFRPDSLSSPHIDIDPWRLSPGVHHVELIAFTGSAVAAREAVSIEVPELAPVLTVTERNGSFVVRGRVQNLDNATLIARRGGAEIARSTNGELILAPESGGLAVELVGQSGDVLRQEELTPTLEAAVGSGGLAHGPLAAVATALLGSVAFVWHRRRRKRRAAVEEILFRRIAPRSIEALEVASARVESPAVPSRVAALEERLGTITVRDPSGNRTDVALTRRPLMIGRSRDCDIVVDDPEVRPEHARVRAISRREVQIHALGLRGARPFEGREEDLWLIAQSGEQILLGSHSVQIMMAAQALEYGSHHDERGALQEAGG